MLFRAGQHLVLRSCQGKCPKSAGVCLFSNEGSFAPSFQISLDPCLQSKSVCCRLHSFCLCAQNIGVSFRKGVDIACCLLFMVFQELP